MTTTRTPADRNQDNDQGSASPSSSHINKSGKGYGGCTESRVQDSFHPKVAGIKSLISPLGQGSDSGQVVELRRRSGKGPDQDPEAPGCSASITSSHSTGISIAVTGHTVSLAPSVDSSQSNKLAVPPPDSDDLTTITLAKLRSLPPHRVIDWLEVKGWFDMHNDESISVFLKNTISSNNISGSSLVDIGFDVNRLRLFFPILPAYDLANTIQTLYFSEGVALPSKHRIRAEGKMPAFFNFCVENGWLLTVTMFVAETLVGAEFHLQDLPMKSVPKIFRPLLNSLFHLTYLWGLTWLFSFVGRIVSFRLRAKFGRGPHMGDRDIKAGGWRIKM